MTDTNFTLADCGPDHIEAVHTIYAHAVLHGVASFETDPPDMGEMRRRWQGIRAGGYPFMVALRGARVLGYAYADVYRTRPAYRGTVECSVYVDELAQGGGVGRALLDELVARCERGGFRQMIAVIGDSANAASIGLHRACGFSDAGVLRSVGWKHGRWLDTVLMQRALGDGDTAPLEAPSGKP